VGTGLTSLQPAIGGRIVVSKLWGTEGSLRIRHRSRLYHRPSFPAGDPNRSVWTHRLTEFAVRFGGASDHTSFGVGRLIVQDVAGLGYLDGAFFSIRLSPHFRAGVAGGTEPDSRDPGLQPNHGKFGVFGTFAAGRYEKQRLESTLAFSSSYVEGTVSREFFYFQNMYNRSNRLHIFQSAELDVNRQWRKEANGGRFSLSNLFLNASFAVTPRVTADVAYDTRQNVLDYETFTTPDSLFDDHLYSGYNAGLTVTLSRGIRIRGNGGVRYRNNEGTTNRFFSLAATIPRFVRSNHSLAARFSRSQTPFITGTRPTLSYRITATRRLRIEAMTGAYFYTDAIATSRSFFGELGGYYTLSARYWISASGRQYFGGNLESLHVFTEAGVNF
jgi:hypothetical protein